MVVSDILFLNVAVWPSNPVDLVDYGREEIQRLGSDHCCIQQDTLSTQSTTSWYPSKFWWRASFRRWTASIYGTYFSPRPPTKTTLKMCFISSNWNCPRPTGYLSCPVWARGVCPELNKEQRSRNARNISCIGFNTLVIWRPICRRLWCCSLYWPMVCAWQGYWRAREEASL